ncbi:DUF6809 family protein [Anaerocolumna cellulosilytica]|uniref:DUF6809 family protein n=1 Tax=Anaerocolumna cellulosilytica TaxID=433286 RepID=UPI002FE6C702
MHNNNPEYRNINNKEINVMEELLEKKVSDEDYKEIIKLMELHTESASLETVDAFECGFRFGALIIIDLLKGNE